MVDGDGRGLVKGGRSCKFTPFFMLMLVPPHVTSRHAPAGS